MPKRIPIKAAKEIAEKYGMTHVIIFGNEPELDHIATYGKSTEQCAQAADFGNTIKSRLGWPDKFLTQPSRVKKLQARIKELEEELKLK